LVGKPKLKERRGFGENHFLGPIKNLSQALEFNGNGVLKGKPP